MKFAHSSKLSYLLFGKEPGAGRKIYIDYLRLLATVFVICVHTFSLARDQYIPGTTVLSGVGVRHVCVYHQQPVICDDQRGVITPGAGRVCFGFFREAFFKNCDPAVGLLSVIHFGKTGARTFLPGKLDEVNTAYLDWPAGGSTAFLAGLYDFLAVCADSVFALSGIEYPGFRDERRYGSPVCNDGG